MGAVSVEEGAVSVSTSLGFERSVVCVEGAPSLELRTQIQALAGEE